MKRRREERRRRGTNRIGRRHLVRRRISQALAQSDGVGSAHDPGQCCLAKITTQEYSDIEAVLLPGLCAVQREGAGHCNSLGICVGGV
jgi:hypothetical protein